MVRVINLFLVFFMSMLLTGCPLENRHDDFFISTYKPNETPPSYPERVVTEFYMGYLKGISEEEPSFLLNFVSSELIEAIKLSSQCNYDSSEENKSSDLVIKCSEKRHCKTTHSNYVCDWNGFWIENDVDYFIKSQDLYPSWESHIYISPLNDNTGKTMFLVRLGTKPDPIMVLKVTLKSMGAKWKIISVMEY